MATPNNKAKMLKSGINGRCYEGCSCCHTKAERRALLRPAKRAEQRDARREAELAILDRT